MRKHIAAIITHCLVGAVVASSALASGQPETTGRKFADAEAALVSVAETSPIGQAEEALQCQAFEALSVALALGGIAATVFSGAIDWPKNAPSPASIEYIYYGSASGQEHQCPLVIQTLHENGKTSRQLISEKPITQLCELSETAHLKQGKVQAGWSDHEQSTIRDLYITATGPKLASFSRIVLRLGGHLQKAHLGENAVVVLDAGLVNYCHNSPRSPELWRTGGRPMPSWSTTFRENSGWHMQMGTTNQWEEFHIWNVNGFIMDFKALADDFNRVGGKLNEEQSVKALDRLCHRFGPTKWNEGKDCSQCCSFTQRTAELPMESMIGKSPGVATVKGCIGPMVPSDEPWAPNW
ncbi:hypothetical protein HPC49_25305 [Pyxidicoccus fallax]|uniref:Lipoprotein n=1 Tax=Pyxidicoccus fallax TaxID=394095 RepID=A0A848LMU4_9BACT|nr:hypothetical protein [Pyxidicoccus fallax]NMO19177.1 hypothetical protein [Pyxidicoccus fallax]NPC81529.1 hypothetical protein [Pyxidicoccus fallax]